MAEHHDTQIDFIPVAAQDIMPERTAMWGYFTKATTWTIGFVIVLLLFIKWISG